MLAAFTTAVSLSANENPSHNPSDIDVAILGDSNTWIGGDSCNKPQGWNYWWVEYFGPASCRSYARSGATWTNTSATRRNLTEDIAVLGNDNVIYNQVYRLIQAVDSGMQPTPRLIIIMAGTNDAWFWKKRPVIFNETPGQVNSSTVTALRPSQATTLVRSVMLSCQTLRIHFPKAKIVLLTPLPTTAATPAIQNRVTDLIDRCGKSMGIDVIRLDSISGFDAEAEKRSPRLTTDGTHTSIDGARKLASVLSNEIRNILTNR